MIDDTVTAFMFIRPLHIVSALLVLAAPAMVGAQAGAATDVLLGRVTDSSGTPVDRATVTATSIATSRVRNTVTGTDGRYVLVFADGGGRYVLHIRRLGFAPAVVALDRRPETDRIVADVTLASVAATIGTVTVTATRSDSAAVVDGTGRTLSATIVDRLPIDAAGDLAGLAALAPGVVGIAATDSSATAFSVGGQRPTQNHVTLDGLTFAKGSVPRDAIRDVKIVTSTYDVSKGQFSGGEVDASTRSGTKAFEATLRYDLQAPTLEAGAAPSAAFSREYTLNRVSGSAGGPLVHERLYAFGAIELSEKSNPLATLLTSDPTTDARLGIAPDTVRRFLTAVGQKGLPLLPAGIPRRQTVDDGSAIVRLDYIVDDANHLTVRGDWHGTSRAGTQASPRALLSYLGEGGSQGAGVLAALTTDAGALTNDVRVTEQIDARRQSGYGVLPRGRVFITSAASGGALSTLDVSVGGNQDFPWTSSGQLLEGGDEINWLSPGGAHRVKVGVLANFGTARTDSTEGKDGVFLYNSLGDFVADRPASYFRVLAAGPQSSSREGAALYAGDAWQPRQGLEIDYGLRAEGARYGNVAAANPAVANAFGLRTDRYPSEVHVSPRLGFTYSSGGDEEAPAFALRGGVGEFRGIIPPFLFSNAAQSTGLASGQTLLTCTGDGVPRPNWQQYVATSGSIPSTCRTGTTSTSGNLPSVVVFSPNTQAPRVWRTSLGATRKLIGPFSLAVDLFYIRGVAQLGQPDINLDTRPKFSLRSEGNRPVYVDPSSIDTGTGAVSVNASRLNPAFGGVTEVQSFLHSETRQMTVGLSGEMHGGTSVDASYTYTNVRDQSLGFDGESADGITAGNPNRPLWGRADEERRHQFEATLTLPVHRGIELTTTGRLVSGMPFTPEVGQDINGDGQRNDRAFVFDPSRAADTAVANGMRRLLASRSSTARDCLPAQFGKVAARNGCTGPWVPGLDFKVNVKVVHGLTVSILALNMLVGVDELLHGSAHLAGWGQDATLDRRLLFVTGFDRATNTFRYQVNQHFGAASGALNPFRIPFVLGIGAKASLWYPHAGDRSCPAARKLTLAQHTVTRLP